MIRTNFILTVCLFPLFLFSQNKSNNLVNTNGKFELGIRSTLSTFTSTGNIGQGYGGQFRIRLGKRINTEWYADYINENIAGLATRNELHVGWSIMIYPFSTYNSKISPYVIVGHCFDKATISTVNTGAIDYTPISESRVSAATQLGIGTNINLTDHFDISLSGQYMVHLGDDLHASVHDEDGHHEIHIEKHSGGNLSLDGHVLFTISINYKIFDLW